MHKTRLFAPKVVKKLNKHKKIKHILRASCLIVPFICINGKSGLAADISVIGSGQGAVITVYGRLEIDDEKRFANVALQNISATVHLSSPGGNLLAGIEIGKTIRIKGFSTAVPDGSECASACALAWLGGRQRIVGSGSKIGFHAAYRGKNGEVTSSGNALVGAYVSQLGLTDSAVMFVTAAQPEDMNWLTSNDASRYGIEASFGSVPAKFQIALPAPSRIEPNNAPSILTAPTPTQSEAVARIRSEGERAKRTADKQNRLSGSCRSKGPLLRSISGRGTRTAVAEATYDLNAHLEECYRQSGPFDGEARADQIKGYSRCKRSYVPRSMTLTANCHTGDFFYNFSTDENRFYKAIFFKTKSPSGNSVQFGNLNIGVRNMQDGELIDSSCAGNLLGISGDYMIMCNISEK